MNNFEKTAKVDRAKAQARDVCPLCQQALWLSFYFDAFGHNKDEDGTRVSNVGKLWIASLESLQTGIRRYYYPGLGTTFNPEVEVLAAMEAKKIAEDAEKAEAGVAKEAAKDTGKKVAAEAWHREEGWWQRVQRTVMKDAKKLGHAYKDQYAIVFNATERARFLRGIGRYWSNFAEDLVHHPMRAIKYVRNELAKQTAGHVAERWQFVRDAGWVAALFNTGVDTRLEAAVGDFKEAVLASQHLGTVKHINVAVFGADMGGALAIAFANKLLKDVCKGGKYEGIEVRFRFMGLFDCVTARYDDNFLTGFVPLANAVAGTLVLPKSVERVVHYAAAHETRLYKRLSAIGGLRTPGGRLEERLFPGTQGDVIGGYEPNEQGIDNQLSRLPLRLMLGRAWRNGVPVYPLDRLENDNSLDRRIFLHYKMDENLIDLVYAYQARVKELGTTVRSAADYDIKDMIRGYADTGVACAPLPEPMQIKHVPQEITEELPGHMALYLAWLKRWYATHGTLGTHQLEQRHKFLCNEIKRMSRAANLSPLDPGCLSKQEHDIWAAWQAGSSELLGKFLPLFERHVHDPMAESAIENAWDDFFFSRHYLAYRPIAVLDKEPEKNYFEAMWDKIRPAQKPPQPMGAA
jgi:hypothetical protein